MDKSVQRKLLGFFEQYPRKTYKSGVIFISPDKNNQEIFFLIKGAVRSYTLSRSGSELTINIFRQYTFFPLECAVNEIENRYYYEAISSDVTLYAAPQHDVLMFIEENQDILVDLSRRILRGLPGYFRRVESFLSGSAYFRVYACIVIFARR